MKLPRHGMDAARVLATLDAFKAEDLDWRSMRTWAYVYPAGDAVEAVAKKAYLAYLVENSLDPTVFPSTMAIENQLVAIAGAHLQGGPGIAGNFTSGGTESILLACKTARDRARLHHPHITKPALLLPVTAHAAFHKACAYFDLEPILVEVDPATYRATAERMAAAITDQVVLMVGSSPSYAHGVIDDIEGMGRLALEHDVLLHVDACVGGWLLPFFRELGEPIPPFDFSVPGVTSMSVDLHKYAFAPKGASLVLYRDRELRRHQIFSCSNWTGYTVINATVQSTKTAGPLAAAWATMHFLGHGGYLERARVVLEARKQIVAGIEAIDGLEVMGQPDFTLVALSSQAVNVFFVADEMRKRGWYIQPQLGYGDHRENVHISVTPGVAPNAGAMLRDLAAAVAIARDRPPLGLAARAEAMLGTVDAERLTDEAFAKLMDLAEIEGANLPEGMAGINEILQALPVRMNEALLARFFGDLNHLSDEQREMLETVRRGMGASDAAHDDGVTSGVAARARRFVGRGLRQLARVGVGVAAIGTKAAEAVEG